MNELIVYPTPHLVQQHKFMQLQGKRGQAGMEPLTYEVFVDKSIRRLTASKKFIGDFKKNVALKNIIQKLKIENKLYYFNELRHGYIQRIGGLIGELKQQDIDPDTFDALISHNECHRDLALIYRSYQDFLQENNLYDQEDRYILCKRHILESNFVSNIDKVHFREFYDLSPIQQKIISQLGNKAEVSNSKLATNIKQIKVVRAGNRRTEIVNLSQEILNDLRAGFLLHKLCIVLRDRTPYEHILQDVFQEMGIPISMQLYLPLLQNPFIKALLKLFQGEGSEYFSKDALDESVKGKKALLTEWIAFVKSLLESKGYPRRLCSVHQNRLLSIRRDLCAYESLVNLFDELTEINQMFPDDGICVEEFIAILEMHFHSQFYPYRESDEGIWVLSPSMLRGLKFDKVYVPGMVEGEFPRDFRPDWLLKDSERAALNEGGYAFDTVDILLDREEEAFDFIMASAEAGYFSYPNVTESNTSVLMSSYLEKLVDLYETTVENVSLDAICSFKEKDLGQHLPGVISEGTREKLLEALKKQPFSATTLNMYGECPYKFFLARVLNLSPPEEEDEFTALDRGTALHKILETFFKNHGEGLSAEKLEEYESEVKALTDEIMQDYKAKFVHPSLFEIEKQQVVDGIIKYVAAYIKQAGDFKPVHFEMGFGYDQEFAFDFAEDILFSGKIDRIDEDSKGRLVIFDYKSSSTPDIKEIEEGTNLQMPLYILAGEQLLKKPVVGGAFISLKKGDVDNILVRDKDLPFVSKRRKKGVLSQAEWDALIAAVKDTVKQYVENIRGAHFPTQPKKCPKIDSFGSFCDFAAVCPWEGEEQ